MMAPATDGQQTNMALTHTVTGAPVSFPFGVPKILLEPVKSTLRESYCGTCGIKGTEISVYGITIKFLDAWVTIECDFCGERATINVQVRLL